MGKAKYAEMEHWVAICEFGAAVPEPRTSVGCVEVAT